MQPSTKKKSSTEYKDLSPVDYADSYEHLPAYYRLQKVIEQEIIRGRKKPGEKIPSERDYAVMYNLSVGTVRKALGNLVQDGLLERRQGKGTFVRKSAEQNESLRYYRYVENFNSSYQKLSIKLLEKVIVAGDSKTCETMRVEDECKFTRLKRVFTLKDVPIVYCISYFPDNLIPEMHTLPSEVFEEQTLYLTIQERFGLPTKEVKEYFSAVVADSETAKQLHLSDGDPVLKINMLASSTQDIIYEYRQSYCNTSSYYLLRDKGLF